MIHFVVTKAGSVSIRAFLAGEGSAVADRVRVVLYDDLARMRQIPLGTWIFAEKDRLDPARRDLAMLVAERLAGAGNAATVLNDPRHVRLRLELLRAAHDAGTNNHRVFPATDIRFGGGAGDANGDSRTVRAHALRYPVFVRVADDHDGNLTPLIDSPRQLVTELASVVALGVRRRDLVVIEFCDTRDDHGLYRKYSAYHIDGRILPRTIECSREWMVKWRARLLDRERADDELRYCETNPHESWIREMFRLARIDYGRIDYGVHNGIPRLWEINTHPWIGGGPTRSQVPEVVAYRRMIEPAREAFFNEFRTAWAAIDTPVNAGESIPLTVPDSLLRTIDRGSRVQRRKERLAWIVTAAEERRGVYRMSQTLKRGVHRGLTPILAAWLRTDPA